jgi:tetratricopeptide (TPR) repeat protein
MTGRPVIFISAVSKELRSARQLVANTLQLLGYEPDWQDIFGTEEGDLRGMLRRKVDASAGVVQLIGQCYGAEPKTPDEQFGRVSYTQYEALYGKQRGKRVWYLILKENFTADPHEAEPEELQKLQKAYRERIEKGEDLYQPLGSFDALENSVLKLRDDLNRLRTRGKQWAAGVITLLILLVGLVIWVVHKEAETQQKENRTQQTVAELKDEMKKLREGIAQYPTTETKVREAGPNQKPEEIEDRTYTDLAKKLGIDAKTLREKLPAFAEKLKNSSQATTYERANASYVAKDYAEAERLALRAADEAQKQKPIQRKRIIQAFELAGLSAQKQIKYDRAMEHFREAETLTDRDRIPEEWAEVQFVIASLLGDEGKYGDAENVLRSVIDVQSRVLGSEHPDTLRSRTRLGYSLWKQNKLAEAEQNFREIIEVEERVLGTENRETLFSRNGLCVVLFNEGKYAEMEAETRLILKIREKVLGPQDQDTLRSRLNLAVALHWQGKYAEAEERFREVIKVQEKTLGPEHPDTLLNRNNLATVLDDEGRYAEAEAEQLDVIRIKEKVLGPEHPDTLASRYNLAIVLDHEGRYAEAEAQFRDVLKVQEKTLGPKQFDTLLSRNNLAITLNNEGKYAEAEAQLRQLIQVQERVFGAKHPWELASRVALARALDGQGRYSEAEAQFRDVINIQEKVEGPQHPHTLDSYYFFACELRHQNKLREAKEFARRAFEGARKVLGDNHPFTKKYAKLVAELEAKRDG